MNNKTLAVFSVASLGLCVLGVYGESEVFTTLGGLGIWVFVIWSAVRLYKTEDKDCKCK